MNKVDITIKRVSEMESIMDQALRIMDNAKESPEKFLGFQSEIKRLEDYYSSQDWKDDFALDEEGMLPSELKRGVLSEDGIYDLLERNKELLERYGEENRMFSKRLAVIFPGIGYHNDKPLLYYSKKLVREFGFDVIEISYDFPFKAKEIKGDKDKMKEAFELAVKQADEQLSTIEFDKCEHVLFIGKSIGTTVAAYYDKKHDVGAKHIVLTPVPQTFDYLKAGSGIVFNGNDDPWCETSLVTEKCEELGLEVHIIERANHSLETKSAVVYAQNMENILSKIEYYVGKL